MKGWTHQTKLYLWNDKVGIGLTALKLNEGSEISVIVGGFWGKSPLKPALVFSVVQCWDRADCQFNGLPDYRRRLLLAAQNFSPLKLLWRLFLPGALSTFYPPGFIFKNILEVMICQIWTKTTRPNTNMIYFASWNSYISHGKSKYILAQGTGFKSLQQSYKSYSTNF